MKIAIINGPNLNFLGIREPHIYGNTTLKDLESTLQTVFENEENLQLSFFQSNGEGELIDFIQHCYGESVDGIVINPGAYTHYSYALADAIKSVSIPTIEVHITNIYQREEFRSHSVTARSCKGVISGLGMDGYELAIKALHTKITRKNASIIPTFE